MLNVILKKVLPIPKIESFNKIMFVGPHPDDIEVGCASTVKKLTDMGKEVVFVVATDGCVGCIDQSMAGDGLVPIRKQECLESNKLLGVKNIEFLPFHDGGMYTVEEMQIELAKMYVKYKPEIIFFPDFNVETELHADHIKVGKAAAYAFTYCQWKVLMEQVGVNDVATPKAVAMYYTNHPNSYVNVTKTFPVRLKCLDCFRSQFDDDSKKLMATYIKVKCRFAGIKRFCKYADSYRVLPSVFTHAIPESESF